MSAVLTRSRVSPEQLDVLLSFMEEHPDFAAGKQSIFSRFSSSKLWRLLSERLNAAAADSGGARKSADKWCRYWADIKYKARRKSAAGGALGDLSSVEERLNNILNNSGLDTVTDDAKQGPVFLTDEEAQSGHVRGRTARSGSEGPGGGGGVKETKAILAEAGHAHGRWASRHGSRPRAVAARRVGTCWPATSCRCWRPNRRRRSRALPAAPHPPPQPTTRTTRTTRTSSSSGFTAGSGNSRQVAELDQQAAGGDAHAARGVEVGPVGARAGRRRARRQHGLQRPRLALQPQRPLADGRQARNQRRRHPLLVLRRAEPARLLHRLLGRQLRRQAVQRHQVGHAGPPLRVERHLRR
ncbi:hypothetical protein ACJJTC_018440 [Scirpophaga incertulas]